MTQGLETETVYIIEIYGGQGRNRTTDTRIFSPLLYRLSYLARTGEFVIKLWFKAASNSKDIVLALNLLPVTYCQAPQIP